MLPWISLDTWFVGLLAIGYLALLFIVAYWGEHQAKHRWHSRPWVYSLSLGVSCTSWAFYGTVGQAASTGAWLAPVYIGSILCFVLAWPMLLRMLKICKQQNLTSIADFIACRYDRSQGIAATIAVVALLGTIPYIALQLRAISKSFDLLTGTFQSGVSTAFIVTLVLIGFSILFGTRQIAISKQNQGLVLAIAFSSLLKLFALSAIGLFVTFYLFDGFADLLSHHQLVEKSTGNDSLYLALSQAILGAITIFILPQQFHMMVIENHHENELRTARWLYPLFLLLINLFVLPIAIAGQLTFPGGSIDADTYVLTLPLFYQQAWLGVLVFIGGLAAATSMVIVAAIVLSNMISNEIINPVVLRYRLFGRAAEAQMSGLLLNFRRIAIALILLLAFYFERQINEQNHLASIGLLSFVLLAQFAPAAVGALYWRRVTSAGAFAGLVLGSLVWLYTLLLPTLLPHADFVLYGPWRLSWLQPTALFGITGLDRVSHGLLFSLAGNLGCYLVLALVGKRSVGEQLQAELFLNKQQSRFERHLTLEDLYSLLRRFTDQATADGLMAYAESLPDKGPMQQAKLVDYTRLQLSGVLGSASTRMVMKAASISQQMPLEDVASIVDEAYHMFQFNRELLQAGVENIEQGISVVDADMRLVAWNKRYIELLNYPAGMVCAGKPIAELLRFNIERGIISGDDTDDSIARRVEHMRSGHSHHFQRIMPNGTVIEIRGQAMPGGGFVSTFSDITAHVEAEKALQRANESLEKRVLRRTQELANAKAEAEAANRSKTRFLAAASHDLMQPFNALTLFTSMLKQKVQGQDELVQLAGHIDDSLNVVEALLSDLVEISRLDSGSQSVEPGEFALDELLSPLQHEFTVLAQQAGIRFHYQPTRCYVHTDQRLLRRVVQNFLSNAIYYCPSNKASSNRIVLGVRHCADAVRIEVWDNGPGIAKDMQQRIFQEFERLEQTRDVPGLGLGLAISERIARLLKLEISVHSWLGQGTCFAITLPRRYPVQPAMQDSGVSSDVVADDALPATILLLDNDALMLTALSSQLRDWGCRVLAVKDEQELQQQAAALDAQPTLIIADYHLDDERNGVDVVQALNKRLRWQLPCIVCSADPSESVREHTCDAQFYFMRKPLKPIALKNLIRKIIASAAPQTKLVVR